MGGWRYYLARKGEKIGKEESQRDNERDVCKCNVHGCIFVALTDSPTL